MEMRSGRAGVGVWQYRLRDVVPHQGLRPVGLDEGGLLEAKAVA